MVEFPLAVGNLSHLQVVIFHSFKDFFFFGLVVDMCCLEVLVLHRRLIISLSCCVTCKIFLS